jgi:CHAD domain-containing protein
MSSQPVDSNQVEYGLAAQMKLVLHWHARARRTLSIQNVHNLRKSIRRCRSLADGLMAVDPDPGWRKMKKAGKKLFKELGRLRDLQVLADGLKRLAPKKDAAAAILRKALKKEECREKEKVRKAVARFDRKKWRKWAKILPERAALGPEREQIFKVLALERYREALTSHRTAYRDPTPETWHQVRINVKRFRYTVENFLPELRKTLGPQLEKVQDLLGEVHDLHVLWIALTETGQVFDEAEHRAWEELIEREQNARLEEYRKLTRGDRKSVV